MAKKHTHPIQQPKQLRREDDGFNEAWYSIMWHPLFAPMMNRITLRREKDTPCPPKGWAVVSNNGWLYVHYKRVATREEWTYVLGHCLLHLGLGHFQEAKHPEAWNIACDWVVASFLQEFGLGKAPDEMSVRIDTPVRHEEKFYRQLIQSNLSDNLRAYGTAGLDHTDMVFEPEQHYVYPQTKPDWKALFATGIASGVTTAVEVASGILQQERKADTPGEMARRWFMNHYPLLGALAANFKVIESPLLCQRMSISVAAVDAESSEIYVNPAAGLEPEELIFVMAHELLHVALRHQARRQGRDPFLWNVACDYVINAWLVEMNIGVMPQFGLLYDPELKTMNAEGIYDLIVGDMRRFRKLATLRGVGLGDMLEGKHPDWWCNGDGLTLDEFYRRMLSQGLQYHEQHGRGYLPAGLVEEILAQSQPPIPWDVELAHWFDVNFPPVAKERSYARPSRRQDATPDIPRPRYIMVPTDEKERTFGVILDTSGSMDRNLLAKALGAIASYSIAREVKSVRVVFCDAQAYDEGYMTPEEIAGRVKIKGRGGTILMPGVRLLENAKDFPKEGPILIITDTYCDRVTVREPREHAFLIPNGTHLPFPTRASVFRVE